MGLNSKKLERVCPVEKERVGSLDINEIHPIELGRQLKKPTGEIGLIVAGNMNIANEQIYDFVLSQINISDNFKILEVGCGNGKFI